MVKKESIVPLNRLVPTLILLSLLVFFVLVSVFLNGQASALAISLRSLVLIIIYFFILLALYEITKTFNYNKLLVIPLGVLLIANSFLPWERTRFLIFNSVVLIPGFPQQINLLFRNFWVYLLWLGAIIITSLFVFITNYKEKRTKKEKLLQENKKNKFLFFNYKQQIANLALYNFVFLLLLFLAAGAPALLFSHFSLFLFLALIPIIADSAAFIGGKLLGEKLIKQKLMPHISPNKTFEGLFCALFFSILFILIFFYTFKLESFFVISATNNDLQSISKITLPIYLIIALPFASIMGDLFFSWIKRIFQLKDYSHFLAGHGGVLDRLDSVLFVNFFFILALNLY